MSKALQTIVYIFSWCYVFFIAWVTFIAALLFSPVSQASINSPEFWAERWFDKALRLTPRSFLSGIK